MLQLKINFRSYFESHLFTKAINSPVANVHFARGRDTKLKEIALGMISLCINDYYQ